eukprot:gi/632978818/ref/XP_007906127.1/ PREDICTED: transport and Golgi organization protein 6 homolog [Callorhinchus milii]
MMAALVAATEALRELVTCGESCQVSAQDTEAGAVLLMLSHNLLLLREKLEQDPGYTELSRLRGQLVPRLRWWLESQDVVWMFVSETLLLLLCLKQTMIDLLASFSPPKPNPRSPECAPALSPDTLSIAQQRTVQAALQFIISLGICPYLLSGVGTPLACRSVFAAMVEKVISYSVPPSGSRRLHTCVTVLLDIAEHHSLGNMLLTRHLGDVIAGLCQLGYSPHRSRMGPVSPEDPRGSSELPKELMAEECQRCQEFLRQLLDRVYQPLVVRQLLLLQGGAKQVAAPNSGKSQRHPAAPRWLRVLCGQLLSQRLMKPHGVQAVVRGILEGAGAGGQCADVVDADWKQYESVARILAACPQQCLSIEEYYSHVCPQVLEMLNIKDKLTARQFEKVATRSALSLLSEQPGLADKYLLTPLFSPLHLCLEPTEVLSGDQPLGARLVEEGDLSRSVENIYKLCVVGNDADAMLLKSLQSVICVIFHLYCFTKQNLSHSSLSQEIVLWLMQQLEPHRAVWVLQQLAGLTPAPSSALIPGFHPQYCFKPGSQGGVRLSVKEVSGEADEVLYEKLHWEQWRLECLGDILSCLPQKGGVAGDFFLQCLKGLVSLGEDGDCHPASGSQPLLDPSDRESQQLLTLQLVAVLSERLGPTVLSNTVQLMEFVGAVLQRVCADLTGRDMDTVETETLSVALGLIAAMLGGGVQFAQADYEAMEVLLAPLEQISVAHRDPSTQQLAAELRITIATHGAITRPSHIAAGSRHGTRGHHGSELDMTSTKFNNLQECGPGEGTVPEPRPLTPSTHMVDHTQSGNPPNNFHQVLQAACDPEVPTRVAALRTLTQTIKHRSQEALNHWEQLLTVFLDNLGHEDSFVYLTAIQGLEVLSDSAPDHMLLHLLREYQSTSLREQTAGSVDRRMKMGEVLMRVTRALGAVAPHYRDPLIQAFLIGSRDADSTMRASSLSNLGELCQRLHFALGPVIHEVVACLSAIVKTEQEAEVRRAAVHVVTLLLRGLSEKALQVLSDVLRDLYRLLKFVLRTEMDEVTVLHAQLALQEMDDVIRKFLFPDQKLEKKIMVLP